MGGGAQESKDFETFISTGKAGGGEHGVMPQGKSVGCVRTS